MEQLVTAHGVPQGRCKKCMNKYDAEQRAKKKAARGPSRPA